MNQPVSSLDLPQHIINKLENSGFRYCEDVEENFDTIKRQINLPEWSSIVKSSKIKTALELCEEESNFKFPGTLITELDSILRSNLIPGCITELCGFPGTGKTQICLHLAVGMKGEVVFIHTNNNLSPERLKEISQKAGYGDSILEKMLCIEATTPVELLASIHYLENWLPEQDYVKMVIIDDIAWPLRQKLPNERNNFICGVFQNLRSLANSHAFTIVLTNNLTTRISAGKAYNTSSFGDSFQHLVNNRILLSKNGETYSAQVLKSVSCCQAKVSFKI